MCPFGFGCGCGCGSGGNDEKREVVREVVVMVPCRYCGTVFPQTVIACPNCGAKRTA